MYTATNVNPAEVTELWTEAYRQKRKQRISWGFTSRVWSPDEALFYSSKLLRDRNSVLWPSEESRLTR
jgi:hypothetical protein